MKRIAILILFLLALVISSNAKVYIVSVGVSDYPGTKNDLRFPAADATVIQELYKKNNGATTIILKDAQATKSNIIASMKKLYAMSGPDDLVVLFFSGHGYKGGLMAYDGRLPYSAIRETMSQGQSKKKMIFADACYAGKFRENKKGNNESEDYKDSEVLLFLSSRSNEKSLERKTMKNGMFTAYLERGLRGYADSNRDRIVTAKELFEYVSKCVVQDTGGRQHPVMWGKFSNELPVMNWTK